MMRGNRSQKHPSLLRGHRQRVLPVRLDEPETGPFPSAPRGLLEATRKRWRELWRSPVASTWDHGSDLPALQRYIANLDRWLRYEKLVVQAPLVRGSVGQLRPNPLAKRMDALEEQMRAAEDRYGLNPVSRLRLGIEVLDTRRSLRELSRPVERELDLPDPRLLLRDWSVPPAAEAISSIPYSEEAVT
jgi:P27 family predicted phage terminase small subunit